MASPIPLQKKKETIVSRETHASDVSRETSGQARVAVINQKGGVGKTTTAVSLAHALALAGKRVLIFDLDPQGNATTALGVEKFTTNPSSYEFLMNRSGGTPEWSRTNYENIDLYPANISLVRAEMELLELGARRNNVLREAIEAADLPHDFIFFDAPPSLGVMPVNILIASTFVLVPVQCEFLALEGLSMLLETLEEVRRTHNPDLSLLGCVLTMVDLRTNLSQQVIKDMRTHMGQKVLKTLIPRTVRLSECPSHGKTIFEYERWGAGARAYESLAKEVLDRVLTVQRQKGETA